VQPALPAHRLSQLRARLAARSPGDVRQARPVATRRSGVGGGAHRGRCQQRTVVLRGCLWHRPGATRL